MSDEELEHPSLHPYRPDISFGDYMTIFTFIVGMTISAGGVYALVRSDIATAAEQNARQDKDIDEIEVRTDKRMTDVEAKISRLEASSNEMRVTQAAMAANLEMLVRAQGMRPIVPR